MWTVLAGALALSALPAGAASAAEGGAPEPVTRTVITDVHTDAISTYVDDGQLVLDTKADTPTTGTRYDSDQVWFHVDDDSRLTLPAGYEFVAPAGATIWLAPEVQQSGQIWPGFSTEAVPAGTLDGDDTTLTLVDVEGPGDVELWQTGSFGAAQRLWSSDEPAWKAFTRKRVHMHANWAFTAAGVYDLTVRADAAIGGAPVSDTQVYTFVVGELPEQVATTTTLSASGTELATGDPVTLSAEVAPASVTGYVEFRDGATVLGHETLAAGSAEMTLPDLAVGSHEITAVFVPATTNTAVGSTAPPVTVSVTDASGQPFEITGVAASYRPGETLSAVAAGVTLQPDQEIRWRLQYQGTTSTIIPTNRTTTYSQVVDANHGGAELQATLYDKTAATTLSTTAWVPIAVASQGGRPVISQVGTAPDPLYPGDSIDLEVTARPLADGETLAWGFATYGGYYAPTLYASTWPATYPVADKSRIHLTSRYNPTATGRYASPLVAYVLRDGIAVSRSEFTYLTTGRRELNVSGARTLYRDGGRVDLDATTYPTRDGDDLTYTWTFAKGAGASAVTEVWGTQRQASPALTGPVLSKAQHHGGRLTLTLFNKGVQAQTSAAVPINVTDDLSSQIMELSSLADHYHQGDTITLSLTADPEPLPEDHLEWQWRWPGTEWAPMPGVVDDRWTATAEQALDGLEIRAVLTWADPTREPLVSAVRTIHEDDHGGLARQKPTVGGTTSYPLGETVTLTRELPANGPTILTEHRWERQAAGSSEWTVVAGQAAELSFPATAADDGASYRVSILTPDGEVAYGPSPAVSLQVGETVAPSVDFAQWPEEFVHGQSYTLAADLTGTVPGASYRWELLQTGATSWYTISDATGPIATPELTFTAQSGWDGFSWRVAVLDGDGTRIAESAPREMRVVLPTPTEEGLHILGLAGHYHSTNPIELSAVLVPEDAGEATYRWSTRRADQAEFHVAEGQSGPSFTATAEQALDGTVVRVERLDGDVVTATSERVTVVVDDHGAAAPQTVTIDGPDAVSAGDEVTLTASVEPETVLDDFQWYLTPAGSETPQPIAGATGATHSFTATGAHDGARVTVAVTGEDGTAVYGPSQPHPLAISAAAAPEAVATKVSVAAIRQVYGRTARLAVRVSPQATGTVSVRVGRKTLVEALTAGRASITVPRGALEPGARTATISYSGVAGEFLPATATATIRVVAAMPRVKVTALTPTVKVGKRARIRVVASGDGVTPTGKVVVRLAGRRQVVTLDRQGRAVATIVVPRSTKPGRRTVVVAYLGDGRVAADPSTTAMITVTG